MLLPASPSNSSDGPAIATATLPQGEALVLSILMVLMDTIPDRIYFKDLSSRFVRNNAAQARLLGAPTPEFCIGKTDFDFFSRAHAESALADEKEIIRTGQPIIAKIEKLTMRDGTKAWASTTKMAWRDDAGKIIGTFGLTRDVTAAKHAEEKLTEERNLLRTIIDHLPARIYIKDTASHYILNNRAHLDVLGVQRQEEAAGRTTSDFFPGERGRQALIDDRMVLRGETSIVNQEKSDFGEAGNVRWSLTTKVPFHDSRGEIAGIVGISHDITQRKQADEELQRRTTEMETDVRMARQVQETFLPRSYPIFPRGVPAEASALRFAHRYIPATTLGGDFFQILQLSDTKCGVLVCAVRGHGVRAGLLTALIRGVVAELGDRAENPARVLAEINHSLTPILERTGQPVFATTFFGVIDTANGTLLYSNAGHPPPLILRAESDVIERLVAADPEPAAGLIEGYAYTRHETAFAPGDFLLAYTDGVFEAANAAGEIFGAERLGENLTQSRGLGGSEVTDRLVQAVEIYSGRRDFDDDVCIVTIESTGTTCTIQPANYEI